MSTKQLVGTIIILALLVLVGVWVWYVRQSSDTEIDTTPDVQGTDTEREPLIITHEYGALHRYGGTLEVPTPCHELSVEAEILEAFPEQIRIVLMIIAPPPDVVCAQVLDRKTFSIDVPATGEATLVDVVFDGASIPFEIFEEAKG